MCSLKVSLAIVPLILSAFTSAAFPAYFNASSGKPATRPLPTYCQMGECFVQTIEAVDPVAFGAKAVLFRVDSQNWHSLRPDARNLKRESDSTSYVLCSKTLPAVIYQHAENNFLVTFLTPNDGSSYGHSNETALAEYFVVCHARSFNSDLFDQGPVFAQSLGYSAKSRDDQPTIDAPEKILNLLR